VTATLPVAAHRQAIRADVAEVAAAMQDVFGQRITATIAGVRDPRAVGKWARGERLPHPETERRLREAMRVTELLLEVEPPTIVRAWFVGLNPDLGDRVPALVVADDPAAVLGAARSFLANG